MSNRMLWSGAMALAAGGIAGATPPFSIEALLLEGDAVEGVGSVTLINNLAVNNKGEWIVEVDTDHFNGDADAALVKDGMLFLREGDPIDVPTGGTIDSFDSVNLNLFGHGGWNLFLGDTGSIFTDSGIFHDDVLVFQEGTVSESAEFSPGTGYIGFFETKFNDDDQILIMASVDDPAIPSTVDRALVTVSYEPDSGDYIETVIAKEGDVLAGQVEAVADFGTDPSEFAFNGAGDTMFVADLEGDAAVDLAIYRNETLIAQEGSASPVKGRNWSSFAGATVALNDLGQYAYRGSLDGDELSDLAMIVDGSVFAQEGQTAPDGWPQVSFGSSPRLNDAGEVVWTAVSDNDSLSNVTLVLDDAIIVHEFVTEVAEGVIAEIATGDDHFQTSPNGNFIIFEAELDDGREGVFLVSFCAADFNRDGALNILDFIAVQNAFQDGSPRADVNNDGSANILDFVAYQGLFQDGCD